MACISGGRWLGARRQCRKRRQEARSTDVIRLRRGAGAGAAVSCGSCRKASGALQTGIVVSPSSAIHGSGKVGPGVALYNWRTATLDHCGSELCQTLGNQDMADIKGLCKALEAVAAAVH